MVYTQQDGRVTLREARPTPPKGGGLQRWQALAETLSDCSALLVSGVGANPRQVLGAAGIDVHEIEGLIEEAVRAVLAGERLDHLVKRSVKACGGTGMGCG